MMHKKHGNTRLYYESIIMENKKTKRIFLSSLEHSAEMHCANLIAALKEKGADATYSGFGGQRLAEAGCEILDDTVSRAAMTYNVLGQLGYYKKLIKQANAFFEKNTVDLVIVCDSPAFNFHIARAAKKHGVPVLFYVAPQLWAWAPWRIHKLRRCCDKLACILPFEAEWFGKRGIDAEFVSNPLFDEVELDLTANFKPYSDYAPKSPKIVLLPGSRDAEIETLWPAMLEIAAALKAKHSGAVFTACAPDDEKKAMLEEVANDSPLSIAYETDKLINVCRRSDYAIVASGSATLQVAAAGCPMTVMYQSNKWMWHLVGRWLVRLPHLSLVNILSHNELVPEFMPYFSSIQPIIQRTHGLLSTPSRMSQTSQALLTLVEPLTERRASDAVAEIVCDMLCSKTRPSTA
ncbi:MAG: lipid-A-disaccharide synthase [Planctomycetales bacterium 4572_13]|nr:MAG: lipid-A-disaccharide synthase [Planctomycetales bacterium 4572_13]